MNGIVYRVCVPIGRMRLLPYLQDPLHVLRHYHQRFDARLAARAMYTTRLLA